MSDKKTANKSNASVVTEVVSVSGLFMFAYSFKNCINHDQKNK